MNRINFTNGMINYKGKEYGKLDYCSNVSTKIVFCKYGKDIFTGNGICCLIDLFHNNVKIADIDMGSTASDIVPIFYKGLKHLLIIGRGCWEFHTRGHICIYLINMTEPSAPQKKKLIKDWKCPKIFFRGWEPKNYVFRAYYQPLIKFENKRWYIKFYNAKLNNSYSLNLKRRNEIKLLKFCHEIIELRGAKPLFREDKSFISLGYDT